MRSFGSIERAGVAFTPSSLTFHRDKLLISGLSGEYDFVSELYSI